MCHLRYVSQFARVWMGQSTHTHIHWLFDSHSKAKSFIPFYQRSVSRSGAIKSEHLLYSVGRDRKTESKGEENKNNKVVSGLQTMWPQFIDKTFPVVITENTLTSGPGLRNCNHRSHYKQLLMQIKQNYHLDNMIKYFVLCFALRHIAHTAHSAHVPCVKRWKCGAQTQRDFNVRIFFTLTF